jgi:hypothetical protein
MFWKVRAMPREAMSLGFFWVMSRPSRTMRPLSGL